MLQYLLVLLALAWLKPSDAVYSKVLIGTDYPEVINLLSETSVCQSPPRFPMNYPIVDSYGGLNYNNEPMICGGYGQRQYSPACFTYSGGQWIKSPYNLTTGRAYGMYATSTSQTGDGRMVIIGGYPKGLTTNIEYLTKTGWKTSAATMKTNLTNYACMVPLNATHYLAIPAIDGNVAGVTYYYDSQNQVVSDGPTMFVGRSETSCSLMRDSAGTPVAVAVAGGYNSAFGMLKSTEYLDLKSKPYVWKKGADMPLEIIDSQMVEHPKGGVVVIGGRYWPPNTNPTWLNTLYYLPTTTSTSWTLMKQKLSWARFQFNAIPMPDSAASCTA